MPKNIITSIMYFFKKKIFYYKKNNKDKLEYYLKNSSIFLDNINKKDFIEMEYSSVMELIELCDELISFGEHHEIFKLPKIPYENLNTNTIELFFNYKGNFIENYEEIHLILLEKIKAVYEVDKKLLDSNFNFFSKSIRPHIIILEKYLEVIFKL